MPESGSEARSGRTYSRTTMHSKCTTTQCFEEAPTVPAHPKPQAIRSPPRSLPGVSIGRRRGRSALLRRCRPRPWTMIGVAQRPQIIRMPPVLRPQATVPVRPPLPAHWRSRGSATHQPSPGPHPRLLHLRCTGRREAGTATLGHECSGTLIAPRRGAWVPLPWLAATAVQGATITRPAAPPSGCSSLTQSLPGPARQWLGKWRGRGTLAAAPGNHAATVETATAACAAPTERWIMPATGACTALPEGQCTHDEQYVCYVHQECPPHHMSCITPPHPTYHVIRSDHTVGDRACPCRAHHCSKPLRSSKLPGEHRWICSTCLPLIRALTPIVCRLRQLEQLLEQASAMNKTDAAAVANTDGGRVQGASPAPRPSPQPCTVAAQRPAGACAVAAKRPAGDRADPTPTSGERSANSPTICATPLAPLRPRCTTLVRPWRRGLWWIPPDLDWRQGRPCPHGARDCKLVRTFPVREGGGCTPSDMHLACTQCVVQRVLRLYYNAWFYNWIQHRLDVMKQGPTHLQQAMAWQGRI